MRNYLLLLLSLLFCGITGLVTVATQSSEDKAAQNKIPIAALLTLSGNFASAGADCREGIEAALSELGQGARIRSIFADSKNEAASAISEMRKLAEIDRVAAMYVNRAAMAMPLNPVSKGLSLPLVAAAGHEALVPGNPFAFQMWPSSSDEGGFLAGELLRRGHKKIAIIYSEDEWTIASATAFRNALRQTELTVVSDQSVQSSDTDFQTLLSKIKASNPEALYVNLVLSQLGPFFRQAHALNVRLPAYTNFYMGKREVLEGLSPSALEKVSYYDIDAGLPTLERIVLAKGSKNVPPLMAVSYIAIYLLNQAAEESRGNSPKDMYDALLRQQSVRVPGRSFPILNRYLKVPFVLRAAQGGQ